MGLEWLVAAEYVIKEPIWSVDEETKVWGDGWWLNDKQVDMEITFDSAQDLGFDISGEFHSFVKPKVMVVLFK